jgi:hypothetical protein
MLSVLVTTLSLAGVILFIKLKQKHPKNIEINTTENRTGIIFLLIHLPST